MRHAATVNPRRDIAAASFQPTRVHRAEPSRTRRREAFASALTHRRTPSTLGTMQVATPPAGRHVARADVLAPASSAAPGGRPVRIAVVVPLLAGCTGPQSALDPRGPQAAAIAELWWIMAGVGTLLLVLVVALALYATLRAPERRPALDSRLLIIGGGLVLPTVLLGALLVHGTRVGGALVARADETPLRIEVNGRQWWWQVRYPQAAFTTANELRIPVGRTVEIALTSEDVIHSFWVPRLAGKTDLIPGRVNLIRLRADEAGAYPGQCAEFCGLLHAHMRFMLVAMEPEAFDAWLAAQSAPLAAAPPPEFGRLGCAQCHGLGVVSDATAGPDLGRFGARARIDRAGLADWLQHRHPQQLAGKGRAFAAEAAPTGAETDAPENSAGAAVAAEAAPAGDALLRVVAPDAAEAARLADWLLELE
jgi:cytochrome c oxidase subunit II